MEKKTYNWIDETINIDFPIPKWWKEMFAMYEQLDEENNEAYIIIVGEMDDQMHEDILNGDLTEQQAQILCKKYYGKKVEEWIDRVENT